MAARPDEVLVLGATVFEIWPDCVRTILPDGGVVVGAPQDNESYRATAFRLGYGADTAAMCRDHEAAHSWICALLGLPASPTLSVVAHCEPGGGLTCAEEDLVLALQRFCRLAGIDLMARMGRR